MDQMFILTCASGQAQAELREVCADGQLSSQTLRLPVENLPQQLVTRLQSLGPNEACVAQVRRAQQDRVYVRPVLQLRLRPKDGVTSPTPQISDWLQQFPQTAARFYQIGGAMGGFTTVEEQ